MDRNLYDILEIDGNASQEQVRKAYKKKALQTHPDRLPPDASAAEKAQSGEQFREINNAYEILNDPQKRKVYDIHGVWPPPQFREAPPHTNDGRRYQPFNNHHYTPFDDPFPDPIDPFRNRHPYTDFVFTDPFILFDSIFRDMQRDMHRHGMPHFPHHHHQHRDFHPFRHHQPPVFPSDTDRHFHDMNNFATHSLSYPRTQAQMWPFPIIPGGFHPSTSVFQSESVNFSGDSRHWTSESRVTSTVNGVTQSIWKRKDSDGNEHITRTFPDGREQYTINGIEQDPSGSRPDRYIASSRHPVIPGSHHRHRPSSVDYTRSPSPPSSSSSGSSFSSRGSPYRPVGPAGSHLENASPNARRKWWQPW